MNTTIILASGSPRRQQFLRDLGVLFEVFVPKVEEWEASDADPKKLVMHNALIKADAVAKIHPERWVLAADTTVAIDNIVLNKPIDMDHAYAMLRMLSGKTHSVYSAVCWVCKSKHICEQICEESKVHFAHLDEQMIKAYFEKINPLDKAGAYAIQAGLGTVIQGYTGSLTNIIGMPMEYVQSLFQKYAVAFTCTP
jgi:septum formation protein